MTEIGSEIKKRRRELGWTQAKLAALSKIPRSRISELERGALAEIGLRKLLRVLTALGLTFKVVREDPTPRMNELQERKFDEFSDEW